MNQNSSFCENKTDIGLSSYDNEDSKNIIIIFNPRKTGNSYCFTTKDMQTLLQSAIDTVKNPYTGVLYGKTIIDAIKAKWNTILISEPRISRSTDMESAYDKNTLEGRPIHRATFLTGNIALMKSEAVTSQFPDDISDFGTEKEEPEYHLTAEEIKSMRDMQSKYKLQYADRMKRQEQALLAEQQNITAQINELNRQDRIAHGDTINEPEQLDYIEQTNRSTQQYYLAQDILSQFPDDTKHIDISSMHLRNIPSLNRFRNLESLNCSENKLTELPALPDTLKKLNCSRNRGLKLVNLPERLEILHCYNINCEALPNLPNSLIELDCSYNSLTKLPPIIATSLVVLNCSYNKLRVVPVAPPTLQKLICNNNNILVLPEFSNLEYLECSNNQLRKLFTLPKSLNTLICENNPWTQQPEPVDSIKIFKVRN